MAITIVDLAAVEVVVATRLKAHMVAQANPPLVAYVGEEPPNQDDDGGAKREVSFVGCSITDDDTTQQGGFAKVTAEFIVRAPEALTRANAYAGSGTVSLLSDALLRRVMTHSGTGVTVELSSVTARPVSDPDLSPRDRVFMVTFSGAAWRADGGTSSVFVPGPEQEGEGAGPGAGRIGGGWTMAVVLTARTAGLRAKVAAINRSTPASRNHAAAVMAAIVARECRNLTVLRGAQDTNRYIRGWEQAHNTVLDIDPAAGAVAGGRLRMSTVKPSTYVRRIFQRLNQAKKRFTGYLNEEEAVLAMEMAKPVKPPGRQKRRKKGEPKPDRASWRNNGRLKRSEKKIVKIRVVLDRINEQYAEIAESGEGYKFGVVIGARSRGRGVSSIDTIFTKLYGGTARYLAPGVMDVRNLEPHARIVSVKRNITGPATALARAIGMKTVGNAYVARVRKAAGVTLRGSA